MPYIENEKRARLDGRIKELVEQIDQVVGAGDPAGTLNYVCTKLLLGYTQKRWPVMRYYISPLLRGVLADVSSEIYRRLVAPYEDEQIQKQGDLEEFQRQ